MTMHSQSFKSCSTCEQGSIRREAALTSNSDCACCKDRRKPKTGKKRVDIRRGVRSANNKSGRGSRSHSPRLSSACIIIPNSPLIDPGTLEYEEWARPAVFNTYSSSASTKSCSNLEDNTMTFTSYSNAYSATSSTSPSEVQINSPSLPPLAVQGLKSLLHLSTLAPHEWNFLSSFLANQSSDRSDESTSFNALMTGQEVLTISGHRCKEHERERNERPFGSDEEDMEEEENMTNTTDTATSKSSPLSWSDAFLWNESTDLDNLLVEDVNLDHSLDLDQSFDLATYLDSFLPSSIYQSPTVIESWESETG